MAKKKANRRKQAGRGVTGTGVARAAPAGKPSKHLPGILGRSLAVSIALLSAVATVIALLIFLGVLPAVLFEPDGERSIASLEQLVDLPPEFLADLPTSTSETLRAAYEEGRRFQLAGFEAQQAEDHRAAIDLFDRALALAETPPQKAALNILEGNSYYAIQDYTAAEANYRAGLSILSQVSNGTEAAAIQGTVFNNLGRVARQRSEFQVAIEFHQAALTIHRENGQRTGEAGALLNLGVVLRQQGKLPDAQDYQERALSIFQALRDPVGQSKVLLNLGTIYLQQGKEASAQESINQALTIAQAIHSKSMLASGIADLGLVYRRLGSFDLSQDKHQEALSLYRQLDDRHGEASQLGNLGLVRYEVGDLAGAEDYFNRSIEIKREIGDKVGEANSLGNLGNVYRDRSDLKRAEDLYRQALDLERIVSDKQGEANSLGALAFLLYQSTGSLDEPCNLATQARALYEELQIEGANRRTVEDFINSVGCPPRNPSVQPGTRTP